MVNEPRMAQLQKVEGAHACALVLKCMIEMVENHPTQFKRGVTKTEMKTWFPKIIKFPYCERCRREYPSYYTGKCRVCGTPLIMKSFELSTYQNRMRDLVNYPPRRAGRHDCPSTTREKRRFFALTSHEKGLVDHSKCWNCDWKNEVSK